MRLSEMVGRRLREANFYARTIQLKLRYKDFTTLTRAHTLPVPNTTRYGNLRNRFAFCFAKTGSRECTCDCSGYILRHFLPLNRSDQSAGREPTTNAGKTPWQPRPLRDKFGESSVKLATGMRGSFRERRTKTLRVYREKQARGLISPSPGIDFLVPPQSCRILHLDSDEHS